MQSKDCRAAPTRTIDERETLVLSEQDRRAFFDALIEPPEPSQRLVRAGGAQAAGRALEIVSRQ